MSQFNIVLSLLSLALLSCGRLESKSTNGSENSGRPSQTDVAPSNARGAALPDESHGPDSQGTSKAGATGAGSPSANPLPPAPTPSVPSAGPTPDLQDAAYTFTLPQRAFNTKSNALWATYYHTLKFNHSEDGIDLLAMDGSALGPKLTKAQWCKAAMEGSVQISFDGVLRTYNYAGSGSTVQVDCSDYYDHPVGRSRFRLARGEFGDGIRNYALSPYRTVAVDPDFIPYGSVLFIPAARGLSFQMFDGRTRTHDGYFFAGDTGGLIIGNHIDVFIGTSLTNPFSWITSKAQSKIEFQIVPDPDINAVLLSMHQ
ncbi:MAG: hypothetical protein RIR26_371 [Pseudomonadota bacterium]|jgi:3D (Asp-Asp-Asp) domain-containing protein